MRFFCCVDEGSVLSCPAQSVVWSFDEFIWINIEVLSVVVRQLITINNSKIQSYCYVNFEDASPCMAQMACNFELWGGGVIRELCAEDDSDVQALFPSSYLSRIVATCERELSSRSLWWWERWSIKSLDTDEDVVVVRPLKESNLPKFLKERWNPAVRRCRHFGSLPSDNLQPFIKW